MSRICMMVAVTAGPSSSSRLPRLPSPALFRLGRSSPVRQMPSVCSPVRHTCDSSLISRDLLPAFPAAPRLQLVSQPVLLLPLLSCHKSVPWCVLPVVFYCPASSTLPACWCLHTATEVKIEICKSAEWCVCGLNCFFCILCVCVCIVLTAVQIQNYNVCVFTTNFIQLMCNSKYFLLCHKSTKAA